MKGALLASVLSLCPLAVAATEVGESDFEYVSDLALAGFIPFATSAAGNASFGMTNGSDLYLCFLADTIELQRARQGVLLAEIDGSDPDRSVPNIPLVCVLTQ